MAHVMVLLRHAKSDWSEPHADIDRPLSSRGRRQAPEAGRWLAAHVPGLDLALVSPAARARATWELVATELASPPKTRVDDRLYHSGDLRSVLREVPESAARVVVVAHNPSLEDLVEELTGRWVTLKTSAIAVVELPGPWAHLGEDTGRLVVAGRPPAALTAPS